MRDDAGTRGLTLHLLAPTVLRIAPRELRERAHQRFGGELRRAGSFAQLCLLGAQACLDAANTRGSLGLLWTSAHGALLATRAALRDGLQKSEPAMPFTFVATQPHLAAALLAQRSREIARNAFLYLDADGWPWLARLAQAWLADCEQVLVGRVEESTAESIAHQSDWCLVMNQPAGAPCASLEDSEFLRALEAATRAQ
jgi:hypothetical protein